MNADRHKCQKANEIIPAPCMCPLVHQDVFELVFTVLCGKNYPWFQNAVKRGRGDFFGNINVSFKPTGIRKLAESHGVDDEKRDHQRKPRDKPYPTSHAEKIGKKVGLVGERFIAIRRHHMVHCSPIIKFAIINRHGFGRKLRNKGHQPVFSRDSDGQEHPYKGDQPKPNRHSARYLFYHSKKADRQSAYRRGDAHIEYPIKYLTEHRLPLIDHRPERLDLLARQFLVLDERGKERLSRSAEKLVDQPLRLGFADLVL